MKSDSYKDKKRIYEQYYRTHILPRKGDVTIDQLRKKCKLFDLHFNFALPENKSAFIVDAGCGNGGLVFWLQQRGYINASGIDGSEDQIAAGQSLGIKNLKVGNLTEFLADSPRQYDVIFLRDVLEHFSREDVLPTLDACWSALKPGGRLVVQVPNGASPLVGRVLYGDFTHELAFTESSLSQIFLLAGFKDPSFRPYLPYLPRLSWRMLFNQKGRVLIVRRLAWTIIRRLYALMLFAEVGRHSTIMTFNLIASARRPA